MSLKENEVIRRATIEDYDAVISILPGKDYDGDYLPDYFHMLMNNPCIKAYVYILDGKIVCLYYQANKHSLIEPLPEIETLEQTNVLNQHDLIQTIKEQDFYSQMFKDNRIIIDTVPYRLMESNIPMILMERTKAVASYLDDNKKSIVTFGSYFKLSNGELFCNLDIYGDVGKALAHHIYIHIQNFVEHIKDIFTIEVRCHESSPTIDEAMSENGLMLVPVDKFARKELICVEKSYYPNAGQARL
ncbi:SNX16 [Mytilus coruscus]|uniref:SNX16 n=1 Tax=Mytilus coruscus TaxID=42192 RepID=A0A6J8EN96_MYTCO|nr:SNX16 [Mytilus coruscus]